MAEKEYIDREALRNELLKISICTDDLYGMGILEGLDRATRRVNDAPAADVVPVVHGAWVDRDGKSWCNVCHASNKQYKPPYCPHCGAKMDGE